MNDYRLDRLSPRLFEHIVQSLAYSAICTTVTPFGDGPDGGREATFEGKTNYGAPQDPWDGYGIIQAKYKLRSVNTGSDARWACTELNKELKQYTRKKNPRPVPEYFIFAVNVVLSPGEGAGKDAVLKIMRDFCNNHGVKGYDLWDYDKLRVLLDHDKATARSYLAWISASDVLADLCDALGERKRDYYKIILRYLQRELLADQYAQLEQAGHSGDEAIPLAQVFIDLPTAPRPITAEGASHIDSSGDSRFVSRIVKAAATHIILDASTDAGDAAINSAHRPDRIGRYVLIGGPGQGKTTVAQYICQIFRSALLADVPVERIDPPALVTLTDLIKKWHNDGNAAPAARRLPFRIVLSEFAKALDSGQAESLMGYLAIKLCEKSDVKIKAEEFEKILNDYPSIIILDGLDEVPASTNRDEVLAAVTNFSIDVATGKLDVFIIATTRPQGYNDEFSPRQYVHHYLVPLQPADAIKYGDRLAQCRFGSNEERYRKVVDRLGKALERPATARLMQTPLQITILTLLVDRVGDPPEERWSLFKEYYQLIYERETERDISTVTVLREHRVDVEAIHRRVGIALQVESERSGGTDARLTVEQFGKLVEDYLMEEEHSGIQLKSLKARIIEAAANRLVFLVGLETGMVGFEIRSLQEFMAAEGITDGSDDTIRERLRAVASSSHWRNVFLFAAGKCFSERRYLRDTILAICSELNDLWHDEISRVLLIGSELALDLLEDGPARKAPLTCAPLTRLAIQLLDTRFGEEFQLASVCEETTRYIYLEELRGRLAGDGDLSSRSVRSAWLCLAALTDRYGGEFEDLAKEVLTRRPLSGITFDMTLELATGENRWLADELFDLLSKQPFLLEIESSPQDSERQFGPWKFHNYPDWLEWYANYCSLTWAVSPRSNISLQFQRHTVAQSPFRRIGSKANSLIPPATLPSNDGWETIRETGRFCEVPNTANLLAVLNSVPRTGPERNRTAIFTYQYPWPLAEALMAMEFDSLGRVEEAVESGLYGDEHEWTQRERSFTEGISIIDIINEESLCPTEDGGFYRFPFRCSRLRSRIGSPRGDLASILALEFDRSSSPLIRRFIASMALGFRPAQPREHTAEWVDHMVYELCLEDRRLDLSIYMYIHNLNLTEKRWSDLFSTYHILGMDSQTRGSNIREACSVLSETVKSNSELRGLLVPLAGGLMSLNATMQREMTHRVEIDGSDSLAVRASAILLRIMAGVSVREMKEDIASVLTEEPRFYSTLMNIVMRQDLPYDEEIVELMDIIHSGKLDLTEGWYFLHRSFSRRQTNLLSREKWERLSFPSTMRTLLCVK